MVPEIGGMVAVCKYLLSSLASSEFSTPLTKSVFKTVATKSCLIEEPLEDSEWDLLCSFLEFLLSSTASVCDDEVEVVVAGA